jgi:endonuclease/exonuclease/phosphatase family metal-dependent hydrolase
VKKHLALLFLAAGAAQAQTYVTKPGFFDPSGAPSQPYSVIQGALCATTNGGTMNIGPGIYRESLTLNRPMTLQTTGLPVTVGQRPASPAQATTFRIVSYNTHLFGNDQIPGLPRWLDPQRAAMIAQVIDDDAPDLVGLQEVWDPDFFLPIGQQHFPHGFYGGQIVLGRGLNSGLAFYSMLPLQNSAQNVYSDINQTSIDALASKGYIRTTITKNGFSIGIFNTHTQSGNASGDISARQLQLQELAGAVILYRSLNPGHAVLLVGDFNVPGETSQHFGYMLDRM